MLRRQEVERGSTQEGDDITAQPLKDELFLPPSSSLPPQRGGDIRQPRWTLDKRATEVPTQLPLDKVGAPQRRGKAGRWGLQELAAGLGRKLPLGPGEFGESSIASLVLTRDKKGSQREALSRLLWVCLLCLLVASGRRTGVCTLV